MINLEVLNIDDLKETIEQQIILSGTVEPSFIIVTSKTCVYYKIHDIVSKETTRTELIAKITMIMDTLKAHKILFISEATLYYMDKDISAEDMNKLMQDEKLMQDNLSQKEAYQIVELTKYKATSYMKELIKDGNNVYIGGELESADLEIHIYKPIQEKLLTLM